MTRILIVEDERVLGEMYKDKFNEQGVETDLVSSTEEAINYLKRQKPDLILLDILLPKQSGISLLKEIKKMPQLSNIPVVVFSNYDDPATKKESKDLGVKAYLLKTQYTPTELFFEVKKFLPP